MLLWNKRKKNKKKEQEKEQEKTVSELIEIAKSNISKISELTTDEQVIKAQSDAYLVELKSILDEWYDGLTNELETVRQIIVEELKERRKL